MGTNVLLPKSFLLSIFLFRYPYFLREVHQTPTFEYLDKNIATENAAVRFALFIDE